MMDQLLEIIEGLKPTEQQIRQMLSMSEDDLFTMLGYANSTPGVLYAPPTALVKGKELYEHIVGTFKDKICEHYSALKQSPEAESDVLLVTRIGDLLSGLTGHLAGVYTIGVLLILRGMRRICE